MDAYAPDREKRREHLLDDCSQPRATQCPFFVFVSNPSPHWLRSLGRQCHRLPICFLTSDLTNQKQEQKNSDCEASWLVYLQPTGFWVMRFERKAFLEWCPRSGIIYLQVMKIFFTNKATIRSLVIFTSVTFCLICKFASWISFQHLNLLKFSPLAD